MKFPPDADSETNIEFEGKEVTALAGAFNEVLHGIRVNDFDTRIGVARGEASQLLDELIEFLASFRRGVPPRVHQGAVVSPRELFATSHALATALERIGFDFYPRVGVSRQEGKALLARLRSLAPSSVDTAEP